MERSKRKKVTLKNIADEANLSVSAASMALRGHSQISEKTIRRVRQISKRLGYKRHNTISSFSNTRGLIKRIGFIVVGSRIDDEVVASFLQEIIKLTSPSDVKMELFSIEKEKNTESVFEKILDFSRGCNGIILSGQINVELLMKLQSANIPNCIYGSIKASLNQKPLSVGRIVAANEIPMGRLATKYLIQKGHNRIGFLCETLPEGMQNEQWLSGYKMALMDSGIIPDPDLCYIAGKSFANPEKAANAFLSLDNKPIAYVIPDIRTAFSFIEAMKKKGFQIGLDSLVMKGSIELAKSYGLDHYPLFAMDTHKTAVEILSQLYQVCEGKASGPAEILIPSKIYNIPMLRI